jgi:GTPase involved in cell partitioning and DNA repair
MESTLKQTLDRLTGELKAWLDEPSEARKTIERIRAELATLKTELGSDGMAVTLRKLDAADREARRVRQRKAAEAIAQICRPLGVILSPQEPPKQSRKPRSESARSRKTKNPPQAPVEKTPAA